MSNPRSRVIVLGSMLLSLLLAGCGRDEGAPESQGEQTRAEPAAEGMPNGPLVPQSATLEQVAALVKDPARDPLPSDAHEAEQVRLGYAVVRDTRQHAGRFVGNDLACANCHLNAGQRDRGLPYVGVAATFPQYRARDGRLISLQDRIADCFERSMNGTAPPFDSPEMMAVSAYITWLSRGLPVGESPEWRGKNSIARENLIPIERLDVPRGEVLYQQQCAVCHGADGQGVDLGVARPGPLWGPRSWNDGAGAARVYTLAGYVRYAMPLTAPGSLTDEQAQLIAAYVNSHDRPAFARKAQDFPNGDVPVDAVYYPRYPENPLRARVP
jgi:thiosulfate dehydrogenase